MEIFLQNLERIAEHNIRYRNGEVTYTLGMNRFGDMTHPEFVARFNGYKSNGLAKKAGKTFMKPANFQAPASMDWRTEGYVTPVKDQGQCGSCWSFSSTGSLEGQHFRKTGQLVSLSEQNLVDCSTENLGCNGGDMQLAYDYIKANHGIDTEASYPYEARDRTCRFKAANVGATITGYEVLRSGDEAALVDALASVGPIAIAIDASHMSSSSTIQVSTLRGTAEMVTTTWTTQFWPYDTDLKTVPTTSSSRTLGALPGDRKDTSRWPATAITSAELPLNVSTQLFKRTTKLSSS